MSNDKQSTWIPIEQAGNAIEAEARGALIVEGVLHCRADESGVVVIVRDAMGKDGSCISGPLNGKGVGAKVTRFSGGTEPFPCKIAKQWLLEKISLF